MKSTTAYRLRRIVNALRYSHKGLRAAWKDEAAFRQEIMGFALLAPLTLCLPIPVPHKVYLLSLMAAVLSLELLNSGLEALVDKTTPERNALAGKAKDCGSAAVLLALLTLVGAWLTLAGPALWRLLSQLFQ